jgi:hypothetical protein
VKGQSNGSRFVLLLSCWNNIKIEPFKGKVSILSGGISTNLYSIFGRVHVESKYPNFYQGP